MWFFICVPTLMRGDGDTGQKKNTLGCEATLCSGAPVVFTAYNSPALHIPSDDCKALCVNRGTFTPWSLRRTSMYMLPAAGANRALCEKHWDARASCLSGGILRAQNISVWVARQSAMQLIQATNTRTSSGTRWTDPATASCVAAADLVGTM